MAVFTTYLKQKFPGSVAGIFSYKDLMQKCLGKTLTRRVSDRIGSSWTCAFIRVQEGRDGNGILLRQICGLCDLDRTFRDPVAKFRKSRKYRNYQMVRIAYLRWTREIASSLKKGIIFLTPEYLSVKIVASY